MSEPEVLMKGKLGGLDVMSVVERPQYINMMIYGESGIGKTVLAGSASVVPELGNVVFVDAEGGTLSLNKRYPDVKVVRCTSFDDLGKLYQDLAAGKSGFQTVVIDSLTELQKLSMSGIMRKTLQEDPDRDPDLPGIGEWGKNIEQIRRLVRAFRDLPMNVIFICLAQTTQDKKGRKETKPSLSGKLASDVAAFLDVVLYMYKRETEDGVQRLILSQSTDEYVAKDRTDNLPPVMENPTMQDLFELIINADTTQKAEPT